MERPHDNRAGIEAIHEAMIKTGLPGDALTILDAKYVLVCHVGSHTYQLAGRIRSVGTSETNGIELFISSPYLGSDRIRSLFFDGREWCVRTERAENFAITLQIVW